MRAQFEGQAAEAMAAARARQAAKVEAAGGREAYDAQVAHRQLVANAKRRAEAADQRAAQAAEAARLATQAARVAHLIAEGMWVVTDASLARFSGHDSATAADATAERMRARGIGASVARPYCGHDYDRYRPGTPGLCPTCDHNRSMASIPGRKS